MEQKQRGRPRSGAAHQAILEAVRDLLAAGGYERLTMEAIAARAGVGKQTVYRRWPSKSAVVAEAVLSGVITLGTPKVADTGDVVADLRDWLRVQFDALTTPRRSALVRGLVVAAADSDTDAARLYAHLTGPSRAQFKARLTAAIAQGALREDTDPETVTDTVFGTFLYRSLAGELTTPANARVAADRLLELILRGVAAG